MLIFVNLSTGRSGAWRSRSSRGVLCPACAAFGAGRRLFHVGFHIFSRLGLFARFVEETEIPEPIDEPELPGAKGSVVAVAQSSGMGAIAVNMHFHIGHAVCDHGGKILIGPDGVLPIAGTGAGDERGRSIGGNGRVGMVAERRGSRIKNADE